MVQGREPMNAMKARSLHRQVGLWASVWLLLAAVTTLVINHRQLLLPLTLKGQGPYQQYLLSHAICASNPKRVLVGTASGLFFSEDGGKSFRDISLPTPVEQVVAVAFHPNNPSHLFAVLRQEGIFSSLDGGNLWTRTPFASTSPIQSFQVGFDGSLSVLTPEGLHRRVGEAWEFTARPTSDQAPQNPSRNLVRLAYDLHDGNFWGRAGVIITDAIALSLLLLVTTGWTMWRQRLQSDNASE